MKLMDNEEEENKPAWIRYIKQRIKNNKNFLGMVIGPTGSGKSLAAITILNLLNKNFNIDMVIFNGRDLMRLINYGDYKNNGNEVIGFLWDEAGVDLSNRNWQSTTNKVINYLLQTFRHRNFVLLFTAPYMDFIDSATRKLFHATFETCGINKAKQTVTIKAKQLQYNGDKKKFYYHYLKNSIKGEGSVKIKRWKIHRPFKELEDRYEKKKTNFTSKLNKEIEGTLEKVKGNGKSKRALTKKQELILECWKKGIKLQRNERRMRNKGYFKENYLEIFN